MPPWHIFIEFELYIKFKFQKDNRLLNISQTMVKHQLFMPKVVFGHFGRLLAIYLNTIEQWGHLKQAH